MTFLLAYERAKEAEGRPWAIELPSGERRYAAEVRFQVPTRTVLLPDRPRYHGYLQAEGRLVEDGDTFTIEAEG